MNEILKGLALTPFNVLFRLSPAFELKLLYRLKTHKKLHLDNPITYNEKVNWLKLYDTDHANMLKPLLCDKFHVREYVERVLACGEILNTLFWYGYNPEDIPFDDLPNRFVIKVTHGSTFNIIVKNKAELDRKKTVKKLRLWLNANFVPCYGEWWYGKVRPRVIVEQYLETEGKGELMDFKVFCFNGEPKLVDVHSGRFGTHCRNVYDTEWNFLNKVNFKYPHSDSIPKPPELRELLQYAAKLSKGFAHVRVDFFISNNRIYFSEFTFANGAGFDPITPESFEIDMGNFLLLPSKM